MSNKIANEVNKLHNLIGGSISDAIKADSGFTTAGIRLRRQMKEAIKQATEIRKLIIQVRKEKKDKS